MTIRKDTNRRVSFKTSGQGRNNNIKARTIEMGVRARLDDHDDEMMENAARLRRRGSPIPRSVRPKGAKMLVEAGCGWYHIVVSSTHAHNMFEHVITSALNAILIFACVLTQFQVPYGQKYDKDFLLKALLQAISPEIFLPHYWKVESTCVSFYVDDIAMARALQNIDRSVELPDGFKLMIKVRNGMPPVVLDSNLRQLMKIAMQRRYSPATKALDLTKFHSDENLRDVYCGLSRPTIMLEAINIIVENTPDLEALNLDSNKIFSLEQLKHLVAKLPNLKTLHLANNKVRAHFKLTQLQASEFFIYLSQFNNHISFITLLILQITNYKSVSHLKEGNILDLVLTGNPAEKNCRDREAYVRYQQRIHKPFIFISFYTFYYPHYR